MASSAKKNSTIDPEQRKLIENAQRRIRQKKMLTTHFVAFLAGSIIFIVLNLVLKFGENFRPFKTDWFVWAILIWLFFFLIHLFNVIFVSKLMGKKWEENQLERLVKLQHEKIEKLQKQVEKEHPLPKNDTQPNRIEPKDNDINF